MQLWKSNPDLSEDRIHYYLPGLTNFLNTCLFQGKFDLFANTLTELKQLPLSHSYDQIRLEENLLYLELIFSLNTLRFREGMELGPRVENYLRTYPNLVPPSKVINYYYSILDTHSKQHGIKFVHKNLLDIVFDHYDSIRKTKVLSLKDIHPN